MEVLHAGAVAPLEWDALLGESDDVWLYHSSAWLELTRRIYGVDNQFFSATDAGRWVGAVPVQINRRLAQASSSVTGAAGPFCVRGLDGVARTRVLGRLTEALRRWAESSGIELLTCALPALAPGRLRAPDAANPLADAGWRSTSTRTRVTPLVDDERLWAGLAYDARRSVKLARTAGYVVTREPWDTMVDDYYRVHLETCERTGARPHPRRYFEGIAHEIAKDGHAVLWVARTPAGQPVAFHNCGRFGGGSLYWTGCSANEHLRSGVNYLLFWEALRGALADGCGWYELGEVFPDATSGKLHGLTVFKSKFGGDLHPHHRGEIRLPAPPFRALLRRPARWARRGLATLTHKRSPE